MKTNIEPLSFQIIDRPMDLTGEDVEDAITAAEVPLIHSDK